jgi:hypothetical protein
MTDTSLTAEDYNEIEEEGVETLPDLYTEVETDLLYEVRFFQNFVLVRPATPTFYLAIKKLSHLEFSKDFREFQGDHETARNMIRGQESDFVITIQ